MKAIKLIVLFVIALTMVALTISLVALKTGESGSDQLPEPNRVLPLPAKRISRFLQAVAKDPRAKNPNAADHCRKDNDVCQLAMPLEDGRNATCCNNKCVDLDYDSHNCGACKKKCFPFQSCCRGECVDLNYDKRHCGGCNKSCKKLGNVCFYGTCGYA